jgi:glycosyltransferase involved in cell wall biosynthesis
MNILHYSLGLPPNRTGGMTQFCCDLINAQSKGNFVAVLFPGEFSIIPGSRIKRRKINNIVAFKIINPKLIPLVNGIRNFKDYMFDYNDRLFYNFFLKNHFDIVHIHTLMGLDKSFFRACKQFNIKVIYTTHDYFGICPKTNLYNFGICDGNSFDKCYYCNRFAFKKAEVMILQSNLYFHFKRSRLLNFIRIIKRKRINQLSYVSKQVINENESANYKKMQGYYLSLINSMDLVHCNSSVSYEVFKTFVNGPKIITKNISHLKISDNRKLYKNNNEKIRLLFLGPESISKGFFELIEVLDDIYLESQKFTLVVYSRDDIFSKKPYLEKHSQYSLNELPLIYSNSDVLIFPSIWKETFGFSVLESLSYGIPVIIPNNVGAKDVVMANKTGLIYDGSLNGLKESISILLKHPEILKKMKDNVCSANIDFDFDNFLNVYQDLLKE